MAADIARALEISMGDEEFASAMTRYARSFRTYRERLPRIPYAYSRTRLAITPKYEIVAMNWAPRSISPIHDHGSSRCWVLMLEGTLDVENFACDEGSAETPAALREAERIRLREGDVDHRLGPTELHRVRNPSASEAAFSLQLYAAPLGTYTIVDARTHARRFVIAACDLELILGGGD